MQPLPMTPPPWTRLLPLLRWALLLLLISGASWLGYRALAAGNLFQAEATLLVGPFLETNVNDPATGASSIWVLWETTADAIPAAEVQYGVSADSLTLSATGITTGTAGATHMHEVQLPDLQPLTQYFYRVRIGPGDGDFGETFRFVSAPLVDSNANFTFVATSDEQPGEGNPTYDRIIAKRVVQEIVDQVCGDAATCPDALALLLSAGDNADQGGIYDEYKPWFDSRQLIGQSVASITALGNHDYYLDEVEVRNWRGYHHFPTNGRLSALGLPDDPAYLDRFDERWYFVDYSNVRFIVLDSNGYSGPSADRTGDLQNAWLDAVLTQSCTDANLDFVVTMMHHTHHLDEILPTDHVPDTKAITDRTERFATECNKPTVHLYGHSHHYNRGAARNHHATYIDAATSGGNIEIYDNSVSKDFEETLVSQASYGFVRADVVADSTDPSIRFRRYSIGYRPNGATESQGVIDDFTITLSANKPVTPTTVSAEVGEAVVTLQASPYSDPANIPQQSAQWQVTTVAGDYSAPHFDHLANFKNFYQGLDKAADQDLTQAAFRDFTPDTTYYWRVRYRNQHNHWSDWSAEASFSTGVGATFFRTTQPNYSGDEGVTIEWAGFPGNAQDWISIAPAGAGDGEWYGNSYLFTAGAKGGSHTFYALPAGAYEARAYYDWPQGAYNIVAQAPFTVTGGAISVTVAAATLTGAEPITVTWRNFPGNALDWIAIAPASAPTDTRPTDYWSYTNADFHGVFAFPPQPVSGAYEARAYIDNSLEPVAVAPFTIQGSVEPTATPTPTSPDTCLLHEEFENLPLGPAVDEQIPAEIIGWTAQAPAGWTTANADGMAQGTTEWQGWSFATLDFWVKADDQERSNFTRAQGAFAIADPDEWDDTNNPAATAPFESVLNSPAIDVSDVQTVLISFDSHYRQEDPQKAQLVVSFDGGEPVELLRYDSTATAANGGADAQNQLVQLTTAVPAGAKQMVLTWRIFEAGNNWFWAVDNVDVRADAPLNRTSLCWDPNATPTPTFTPTPTATPTPQPTATPTPDPQSILFREDFESVKLGPAVDELMGPILGWSPTAPEGWRVENVEGMPQGTTEWQGWTFTNLKFWVSTAPGQNRENWTLAQGIFAVVDPDEWDDTNGAASQGDLDSSLFSPAIDVTGQQSVTVEFDSHYRQEDTQATELLALFDTGAVVELLYYDQVDYADNAGVDVENSRLRLGVEVPIGAKSMTLQWRMFKATNDWYWAIDNVQVIGQPWVGEIPTPTATPVLAGLPFSENFDSLEPALQPAINEQIPADLLGWTHRAPKGWAIDNRRMPAQPGTAEWQGWSFTTLPFWVAADDQDRSLFAKASGVLAVADPDEWDDTNGPAATGTFHSLLTTPPIAVESGTLLKLSFVSHYRQEGDQTAAIWASFNGRRAEEIFRYDLSNATDLDRQNEEVIVYIPVPANASTIALTWQLRDAGNNWFWAIDNIVLAEQVGPTPTATPTATPTQTPTPTLTPTATPVAQAVELPLTENFDALTDLLQPAANEAITPTLLGWTHTAPVNWSVDNSNMPATVGMIEWQGWSFATKEFWLAADQQERERFDLASGVVAIADADEWDDLNEPSASGKFNSLLSSPPINVTGGTTVTLRFASHYRQEDAQTALVIVSFDVGEGQAVLGYDSTNSDDQNRQNEQVELAITVPADAQQMVVTWQLRDAGNNWFWAIDNVEMSAE
ncbi:MAG: fibronectin type III domain-containing protein [Caldilineaceae bacterium]